MRKRCSHASFAAKPRSFFVKSDVLYEWLVTTLVMYTFSEKSKLANACTQHQRSLVRQKDGKRAPQAPLDVSQELVPCFAEIYTLKQDLGWKVPGIDVQLLPGF